MLVKRFTSLLILYLVSYTLFIICVSNFEIEWYVIDLWRNYSIIGLLFTIFMFSKYEDVKLKKMLKVGWVVVFTTYAVMLLNSHFGDIFPSYFILTGFYICNLALSILVLEYSNRNQ
jgi:hypothetical protein